MYVSKIEHAIEQLQQCVDESKTKLLDNTKIIVDREEIQGHINELRKQAPEEIAYLRKIVDNRDAILRDAKEKAEALINKATAETTQLLSENQIMQQAYKQADEVINCATYQAQDIIDRATMEANQVRAAAMQYMDDMLANVEQILVSSIDSNNARYQELQNSLNHYYQIVKANRQDLHPADEGSGDGGAPADANPQVTQSTTGEINLDII